LSLLQCTGSLKIELGELELRFDLVDRSRIGCGIDAEQDIAGFEV
jgi:hypothetical protein